MLSSLSLFCFRVDGAYDNVLVIKPPMVNGGRMIDYRISSHLSISLSLSLCLSLSRFPRAPPLVDGMGP